MLVPSVKPAQYVDRRARGWLCEEFVCVVSKVTDIPCHVIGGNFTTGLVNINLILSVSPFTLIFSNNNINTNECLDRQNKYSRN
jgi:hypothetical protein